MMPNRQQQHHQQQHAPALLSLRMSSLLTTSSSSSSSHSSPIASLHAHSQQYPSFKEAVDRLSVMSKQEVSYQCRDYLGRRGERQQQQQQQQQQDASPGQQRQQQHLAASLGETPAPEEAIDEQCRTKMVEWSFRVCDHFRTNREIVAFAFSLLDRFVDQCCCDRTAFKLASMTALYMSTKLFNAKQISISSLAELSRGEFEMTHISEMECIILDTLCWRLNPPTVPAFIDHFRALLPQKVLASAPLADAIHGRAIFFAELSVYDYSFVTQERRLLAIAAILNALDDLASDEVVAHQLRREFLVSLETRRLFPTPALKLSGSSGSDAADGDCALEDAQHRLWHLYSCSAQQQDDDSGIHTMGRGGKDKKRRLAKHYLGGSNKKDASGTGLDHSPVSVNNLRGGY